MPRTTPVETFPVPQDVAYGPADLAAVGLAGLAGCLAHRLAEVAASGPSSGLAVRPAVPSPKPPLSDLLSQLLPCIRNSLVSAVARALWWFAS